jgi:hypothetical protein
MTDLGVHTDMGGAFFDKNGNPLDPCEAHQRDLLNAAA